MVNMQNSKLSKSISKTFSYLDWFNNVSTENWMTFINIVGIGQAFSPKEFMDKMKHHPGIVKSIDSRLLVAPLFGPRTPSNAFVVNDLAEGQVCKKCGNTRAVLLLTKRKDYNSDLDKRVFLPWAETYMEAGIKTNDPILSRAFRIPVNEDDYWYCPYCNELHRFKYDKQIGLLYDQEILNFSLLL